MIPTLLGRWHTRLLLYVFIGLPVTFLFAMYQSAWQWPPPVTQSVFYYPFLFITLILLLGLILDVVYIQIQRFHWDQDWPFAYQFFFSILEFYAVYYLMYYGVFDYLWSFVSTSLLFSDGLIPLSDATWHFTFVFIPSFLAVLGGVQVFLVRWRFKGGELGRHRIR